MGVSAMDHVLEVRADVLNFREEARGCFQLAEVETDREVRTVLFGMALGWLRLAKQVKSSDTLQFEPADDS